MDTITAKELNGAHVGAVIQFQWEFPLNSVQATVKGMVRKVYHSEGSVDISLTAPNYDDGIGNHQDFEGLHPSLHVEVLKES